MEMCRPENGQESERERGQWEEPIAIVGMGCRWPGSASNPSALWDLLINKRSTYSDFDASKINIDAFYHPSKDRPGCIYTKGGYFLDEDTREFDHSLFGINPVEVGTLDPAQRKLLEATYEAFEDAGATLDSVSGSVTGVYISNFNSDHQLMQFRDPNISMPYEGTGGALPILSNRLSYVFNIHGPSLTVDTACSGSLYALHLACNALLSGDCEAAIAGAANLILTPDVQIMATKLGTLSPTSQCHTFDVSADGYGRGEGIGVLYLKRLSDAIKAGDPIKAVVRATAVNANGKTSGISRPSAAGQEMVIRRAYQIAGNINPRDTDYFECHGTGTEVGDPLEVSAIGRVFALSRRPDEPLLIGAVKTNLGHSEAAAGFAGVMKVVLAMEKGIIPATVGIKTLNPDLNCEGNKVHVVTENTPWPAGHSIRRASVNSFGYGGANAHAIIESASLFLHNESIQNGHNDSNGNNLRADGNDLPATEEEVEDQYVLAFSANSEFSLNKLINAVWRTYRGQGIADMAYTLGERRSRFRHRTVVIGNASLFQSPTAPPIDLCTSSSTTRSTCYVFTGQGAQWPSMGKELLARYPVFLTSVRNMDNVLQSLVDLPWTIEGLLCGSDSRRSIHEPSLSQPVCTAVQIALVDLLSSWNIHPVSTVGHSSGEIAAAYASGYLSMEEAIIVAYCRGETVCTEMKQGSMLAVGLSATEVREYLTEHNNVVKVACINSPVSVTLSGELEAIQQVKKMLAADQVFVRELNTGGKAYHSHLMATVGEVYERMMIDLIKRYMRVTAGLPQSKLPRKRMFSSVYGKLIREDLLSPSYWRQNLEQPVLFSAAVDSIQSDDSHTVTDFIEIGPHSALKGPLHQILQAGRWANVSVVPTYHSTLLRETNPEHCLLQMAGKLFVTGHPIHLGRVNSSSRQKRPPFLTDLPTYQYDYGPTIAYENQLNRDFRLRKYLPHDLLGSQVLGSSPVAPSWRNTLRIKDVPWLRDHMVDSEIVFPGACYLAMAVEAVSQLCVDNPQSSPQLTFTFRNVNLRAVMIIPDDEIGLDINMTCRRVAVNGNLLSESSFEFEVTSRQFSTATEHCRGTVIVTREKEGPERQLKLAREAQHAFPRDPCSWYDAFDGCNIKYKNGFRGIQNIKSLPCGRVAAEFPWNPIVGNAHESSYPLHPVTLDLLVQLCLVACHSGQPERMHHAFLPTHLDEVKVSVPTGGFQSLENVVGVASGEPSGLNRAYSKATLLDSTGRVLVDVRNLVFTRNTATTVDFKFDNEPLHCMRLVWKPDISDLTYDQARTLSPPVSFGAPGIWTSVDLLSVYLATDLVCRHKDSIRDINLDMTMQRYWGWMTRVVNNPGEKYKSIVQDAAGSSQNERTTVIDSLHRNLRESRIEVELMKRMYDNFQGLLDGTVTAQDITTHDDLLAKLYTDSHLVNGCYTHLRTVVDLLGHKYPNMRILEIGAGTGGATREVLKVLSGNSTMRRYQSYTYTDVSAYFLGVGEQQFSGCGGMSYQRLDIESESLSDFPEEFDLIIAANVLHATTELKRTMENVRKLLSPTGHLLLVEATRPRIVAPMILGGFSDFWKGYDEGRIDGPFISDSEWKDLLSTTGFSSSPILLWDFDGDDHFGSVILTRPFTQTVDTDHVANKDTVHLITRKTPSALAENILSELSARGTTAVTQSLVDINNVPSRVILMTDIEGSIFMDITNEEFTALKLLIKNTKSLLWVTNGARLRGKDPSVGLTLGFLRTIQIEYPHINLRTLDLGYDAAGNGLHENAVKAIILQEWLLWSNANDREREVVFDKNMLHIVRAVPDENLNHQFSPAMLSDKSIIEVPLSKAPPFKYDIKIAGSFKNLFLVEDHNPNLPLEANDVEVHCKAIGLNMHDLGVASGNFDGDNLSNEFTGVVSRVGEGVIEFTPGDRVFGIGQGNFGNFIRVGKHTVRKIPTQHSFEAIASMPLVYATAIYALQNLARLRAGEMKRVLIHSASGGLGIAAIVIAQMLKAEIFATVGTDSKRRFLIERFQVPEERILLSDNVKTDEIMRASDGMGMNVILSSANNETLQELWGSIAPLGRFIDVGRMQALRHGKLEMDVFSRNATFASFDLELVSRQNPTLLSALMDEIVDLLSDGKIYPIMPLTKFVISELAEAMSFMAKRVHMGKIVLSLQEPETQLTIRKTSNEVTFSPNASYLLVGCLGGLGRSLTSWMVERGATNLVFLSRSGTNNREAARFVQDLLNRGIDVSVVQGDVSVFSDVEKAISSAPKPIQGVVHAGMALCDVQFDTMPLGDFEKARNVKAHGAINLHKALENTSLDFFLMTSSFLATMGSATQAAYCAANAFLDSFAQYRRQQGLPALSVAFDVLSDVGFASINRQLIQNMKRNGFSATTELELRNLYPKLFTPHPSSTLSYTHNTSRLLPALEPESSHIILGLDPHKLRHESGVHRNDAFWMGDPRFSIITRALTVDSNGSVRHSHERNARNMSIRDRLQEIPVADHSSLIRQIFTEKLAALLFISTDQMDANVPLSHFGLDSMIASEMRHWCLQNFGRGGSSLALLEPTTTIDSLTMAVLTTSTF